VMAAAGADKFTDASLQRKKEMVRRVVSDALGDIVFDVLGDLSIVVAVKTQGFQITLSRDGVAYMGVCDSMRLGATTADWNRLLSEGLGTKFNVDWRRTKYSRGGLRVLRLGEPIYEVMRARGLNPEWDGTEQGDFTITVVDDAGAKLAVAMALHSRLGADSPLFLVAPWFCTAGSIS